MLLSAFQLMVRGPSSAGIQWKPIDGKNRDTDGATAKNAALFVSLIIYIIL